MNPEPSETIRTADPTDTSESPKRQTRSYLMNLFQRHGFHPRHDLGQNFLIDVNVIDFIVAEARLTREDVVLEVGAGTGGLTSFMAAKAGHVVSVEVDRNMLTLARDATAGMTNVTFVARDALRNKNNFADEVLDLLRERVAAIPGARLKLVANLPYHIATPVMSNLVLTDLPWVKMVAMIQLELGRKMAAGAGHADYGALSVWMQAHGRTKMLKKVGPQQFWPRPKVDSAVVAVQRQDGRCGEIADERFFLDFLRRLFHHRRKLMRGVLCTMYKKELGKETVDAVLAGLGHGEKTRAETLEPGDLIAIANRLRAAIGEP